VPTLRSWENSGDQLRWRERLLQQDAVGQRPASPGNVPGGPSLGQGLARLDWGRPSACRYFHGHAIGRMRTARNRSPRAGA
jgi:hypothetical protein